jgi:3-(3-hydroxy-phenyl)propionate hydroxylase
VYQFHGLVATEWRSRSVILVGDAAHQMPPFMGQGMCSGIRDAANLAWKLAFVLRGHASPGILGSYQTEREPHVRSIVERAIELGRVVCMFDEEAARARDLRLKALMANPENAGRRTLTALPGLAGGIISGTALAGRLFPQPFARRRDDGAEGRLDDLLPRGFWLITRGTGSATGALPDYVHPVRLGIDLNEDGTIDKWLGDAEAALVRPDRYVFGTGREGDLVDELTSALRSGGAS